ncbi:hypothetical protein H4Q26_017062 [Puccinia striiformis f. sp. tritici PST-130]|nr:hypothetical protein H4Q26_017062 [Puccinia striiformis f. sp. tritici PST-130]
MFVVRRTNSAAERVSPAAIKRTRHDNLDRAALQRRITDGTIDPSELAQDQALAVSVPKETGVVEQQNPTTDCPLSYQRKVDTGAKTLKTKKIKKGKDRQPIFHSLFYSNYYLSLFTSISPSLDYQSLFTTPYQLKQTAAHASALRYKSPF